MHPRTQTTNDIDVNARRCRRCAFCIQICPAKAIKFEKDNITIISERCIYCGSCISVCPMKALNHMSGLDRVKGFLRNNSKVIACLDPAFPAALDAGTPKQLVTALKKAGFAEVWEGAFGAELVSQTYLEYLRTERERQVISSFCPVIFFYVQKYLPQLIPNLAPFVSPMIAVGRVARKIKGPEWKIVYITACFAHMKERKVPEVAGVIDEVISFGEMRQILKDSGTNRAKLEETDFDGPRAFLGRVVPVIGGLNRSMGVTFDVLADEVSIAYGRRRTISALNQVATGDINAKFVDFVYCDGCVDGPFVDRELSVVGRRQIVARYVKSEMSRQTVETVTAELEKYRNLDLGRDFENLEQKLPTPTEEQIRTVLKKIDKLPPNQNLDCRACGYPTCRDKAIAVVQGISETEYCLPYLLEQSKKVYQQLEKSHRELQYSHQELAQTQDQLVRTEKLAALGQLAAGVAHEINNPLGTITIYAHLLLKSLEADDPRREDVSLIISEAHRSKEIVQGLLSFARETKLRPGPIDFRELIEEVLGLLVNQPLFHNIKISKAYAEGMPTVTADGTQLKQVFLNIMLNAAQAMEGKGKLSVSTQLENDHVKIRIRDTGPGIPPEIMTKLFLPFFTTKEKGTGLGLAISYGIVERHGGRIDIETKLGKGSVFIISLPISDHRGEYEELRLDGLSFQNTHSGRGNYEQKTKNLAGG